MKIMVDFAILLFKTRRSPRFIRTFYFDFAAICKHNFFKPTLFSFGYDYYASARTVAPQLNRQFVLLLKRPLTHYWTSHLNACWNNSFGVHLFLPVWAWISLIEQAQRLFSQHTITFLYNAFWLIVIDHLLYWLKFT